MGPILGNNKNVSDSSSPRSRFAPASERGPLAKMHGRRPWKRQVEPMCAPWMERSVQRLEQLRADAQEDMSSREREMQGQDVKWMLPTLIFYARKVILFLVFDHTRRETEKGIRISCLQGVARGVPGEPRT